MVSACSCCEGITRLAEAAAAEEERGMQAKGERERERVCASYLLRDLSIELRPCLALAQDETGTSALYANTGIHVEEHGYSCCLAIESVVAC